MTILSYGRSSGTYIRFMPDPVAVNSMFARIARRYDLANHLLSGGMDLHWRNQLVEAVNRHDPTVVLDLATGSGDVAFALNRRLPPSARILGMEFCRPMLAEAEIKKSHGNYRNISFVEGDVLSIPLPDATCDVVTIAFGLRNLADRARGLREMHRVLRPGGHLFVLEFSQPPQPIRSLYYFYLRQVVPRLAGRVTGDRPAYDYLNASIGEFPARPELSREISAAGFSAVKARAMTFCIVALHEATRS